MKKCYNIGNIEGKNEIGILYIGGITGCDNNSSGQIIENCYNTGKIIGNAQTLRIGGIIGYQFDTIESCYNIGNVEGIAVDELNIGMLVGRTYSSNAIINNAYYQKNDNNIKGIGTREDSENMLKTETEMKEENFVDLLNQTNNGWKKDTNNINKGYPILDWQ